ncbi:MAG TPA: Asp-tRNA(Asn)/Glu-tRNA(Gln) amidotransferase subunit GatB [Candidatus Saccharimonadia bacterium]|jgi:aspartyl-tRNA(Asn)/glutamyl-tRNA(Gln) amidotransferase subunit B|nr:Asp-tRNA(Asn)/Glu-tRNA(Gln) amidotransferase subunit GatB [Candidatus Saccharimonadia bacterium]
MNPELEAKYETVIGIECHVQLATKSKLFCSCDNDSREAEPNTHVCEVCMGLPGTLPVLNKHAVELAIRMGLALGAQYPDNLHTKFDRKNYFYPDLPKGYQITQFDEPVVPGGAVEFPLDGKIKHVGITRAHLEGDAGKLTHPDGKDFSLVDLNRAETPLLEIVSEPDMRSAAEAKGYAQELYNLARYAAVSDANLYYGNMRFDVNVSVRPYGQKEFGTRTETKNLNSFRAIEKTVEYETKRQIAAIEAGERIRQETRGWNEAKGRTYPMRSKEDADEYRYFPEPDLPPVVVTRAMVEEQANELGLLPHDLRAEIAAAGLPAAEGEALVADPDAATFWHHAVALDPKQARFAFTWLIGDRVKLAEDTATTISASALDPQALVAVGRLVGGGKLSSTNAKTLMADLWDKAADPLERATKLGLLQESDEGELGKVVDEVIAANAQAVADYKGGNERAFGALVGQAMKATRGKGNPPLINKLLKDRLG